mmetsp:Transcript_9685/g.27925  ORF Transcript_9685/g.27925 Transcript_9685/m.27925 type:complete len:86 (-) Transcript_9685:230-487(-)
MQRAAPPYHHHAPPPPRVSQEGWGGSLVCVEAYAHDRVPCSSRAQYDMNSGSRPQPQGTKKLAKTTDCIGAVCLSGMMVCVCVCV